MGVVIVLVIVLVVVAMMVGNEDVGAAKKGDEGDIGSYQISITSSFGTTSEQALSEPLVFVASSDPVRIGAWTLPAPLFYVSPKSSISYPDASLIETSLPIAGSSTGAMDLGYWPTFRDMSPTQRRQYFDWLAEGRHDPDIPIGYVFVFFYGLERRLLIDGEDVSPIFQEVIRLLSIYQNNSFQGYARGLLSFYGLRNLSLLTEANLYTIVPMPDRWDRIPETHLQLLLAWYCAQNQPLPIAIAIIAAAADPRTRHSVVVDRVREEFLQVFDAKYRVGYPHGLTLRSAKREKRTDYHAASSTLRCIYGGSLEALTTSSPNPLGLPSQFKKIVEIWNSSIDSLKGYSRAVGKADDQPLTSDAWEKLPDELKAHRAHPEGELWEKVVSSHMQEDGSIHINAGLLAEMRGIEPRDRLTITQCRKLCDTAQEIGLGLEPDPRQTRSAWRWQEKVAIFRDTSGGGHLAATSKYAAASLMLRLGMHIAASDGVVDEVEVETVTSFLEGTFSMTDAERHRLEELAKLLTVSGSSLRGLAKKVEGHLTLGQVRAVGKLLVAVAAADGVIDKAELAALRKTFHALGLEKTALDEILEDSGAVQPRHGKPILVREASENQRGETIPPRKNILSKEVKADSEDIVLDAAALQRIVADTQEVASILHDIFDDDEHEEDDQEKNSANVASKDGGLDTHHSAFLETLVTRDTWGKEELVLLARQHDLMPAGAIEVINNWAIDKCDEPMIHGNGPYEVDLEIAEETGL